MRAGHAALLIEVDLHFLHRQFQRTALEPPPAQHHRQLVHPAQQGVDLRREFRSPRFAIGQILVDFFIGKPPLAADGRVVQFDRRANALGRELDERRLRVTHPVGLQAGQIVRHNFRQHRNHAVGQIHAGGPFVGFAIERRFVPHKMRHVGNVHAQPPVAVVQSLQRNGIVEIAGIDRIDGDDRLAGQIDPAVRPTRQTSPPDARASSSASSGKLARQIVFANDRQRIDARRAFAAQHFGNHPFAVVKVRRKADHLEHDFVVRLRVLRAGIAHVHRPREQLPSTCT